MLTHDTASISCSLSNFGMGIANSHNHWVHEMLLVVQRLGSGIFDQVIKYTKSPLVIGPRMIIFL